MSRSSSERTKRNVLNLIAELPPGRVTTYGAIARELQSTARQVASIMARLTPDEAATTPWHRVVGAQGVLKTMGRTKIRQAALLRAEAVIVSASGRIQNFNAHEYRFDEG